VSQAIWEIFLFTTPIILGLILNCGMEAITIHYLGQTHPDFLAATGIAIMIKALIVVNIILGSVRAMETLCINAKSEAMIESHDEAEGIKKGILDMNHIFNKGRMILCVQLFLLICILWRTPVILTYFG
jgi:hypothetical protein